MKILWICFVWPEPGSSAAGVRTKQLLECCKQAGHEMRISSPCQSNVHREQLQAEGFSTVIYQPNDSKFDEFVAEFQPDIVFFDRFMIEEQFSWRVKTACPEALRVLDTIDLHFLRRIRQRIASEGRDPMVISDEELLCEDAFREVAAIYRSDLSLIVSDAEMDLLQARLKIPKELLALCRLFYRRAENIEPFERRKNFITIGNFNHLPNADSFKLLKNEIWPAIRVELEKLGLNSTELHIYGAYPTKEIMHMDDPDSGFQVKGWAKNLPELFTEYRVNLAPLRFGAGIKGKICDGWAAGTPCIATTISAEGMHTGMDFGGAVQDDWQRFVEEAVELYLNQEKWQQASQQGAQIIDALFDHKLNAASLLETIDALARTGLRARSTNFIGAMLWHHQFRSTEFMSRWIEAKQKLIAPI